jgi:hypothetical protein
MGYEKFVMDVDQAGMMHTLLAGVDLSPNGQALDAMREVGPGKHFLGCAHTQANFENAFYRSPLADNNSYEQWEAEGATDMAKRANALWKKQLAEYVEPPMDPAIDEALLEYIAKRKAAFPDVEGSSDRLGAPRPRPRVSVWLVDSFGGGRSTTLRKCAYTARSCAESPWPRRSAAGSAARSRSRPSRCAAPAPR